MDPMDHPADSGHNDEHNKPKASGESAGETIKRIFKPDDEPRLPSEETVDLVNKVYKDWMDKTVGK
jgi:hypothetical protein